MGNDKKTEIKGLVKRILYASVRLQRIKYRRRVTKHYVFFSNYPFKNTKEKVAIYNDDGEVFNFLCNIIYNRYGIKMEDVVQEGVYEYMNETRPQTP